MRGWSRKEVIEYWKLSGIPFAIDGYGVVIDQSLPAGTTVDGNSEVAVAMGVIETDIDLSKKPLEDGEE